MTKPKLTYFDFHGGRGEDCRLALHIAGVDFEDARVGRAAWTDLKPRTPFGGLPVLTVDDRELGQSNAILGYIGRRWGLLPSDEWEAARHVALLEAAEDLRGVLGPTLSMKDEAEKKKAREEIAAGYLQTWAANVERQLGDGPFVGGDALSVADLKLYVVVRWLVAGGLDHVPADALAGHPKLMALYGAVDAHPGVRSWRAAHA